jgi:colanic acid/amylovoran biosynthesis glycosyltransferase
VRIIYVTSTLPYGKKEAFVIPEVRELKRRGHDILIVPTFPRGRVLHEDVKPLMSCVVAKPLLSAGIVREAITQVARNPAKSSGALRRLFESRSAGVLVRNLAVYLKGLWLAELARDREVDHIHAHWATVPASMAFVAAEVSGLPWSVTAHRFDIAENNLLDIKAKRACFIRAINRRGLREIVAQVSPEAPVPSLIHMGVALPPTKRWQPQHDNGRITRIVVPANLLEIKGHRYLLKATRLLRDRGVHVHVDLAGDGPLRTELESEAEELGLQDRVTFLGVVSHKELLEGLRTMDWGMLVLPSIVTDSGEKEGIPVAIIESMSCRVPVVSTMTGGIPELFEGVDDALLLPPRDPAALADAIERLIKDPGLRERLMEAGRRRVEERFAIEKVAAQLAERFEMCCTDGRSA